MVLSKAIEETSAVDQEVEKEAGKRAIIETVVLFYGIFEPSRRAGPDAENFVVKPGEIEVDLGKDEELSSMQQSFVS